MIENPNILIVDDERSIAELVAETLQGAGMFTQVCVHAGEALPMVREGSFDLIILDVMMPGVDGFELCARMRAESFVPIIFLSAKDEEADKVLGLTCGGDDYITKPFLPRELVARVKSCLRRSSYASDAPLQRVLRCRGIELDPATHVVSLHGERLSLTPKEFDLLAVLLRASGRPVATQDLYEAVWEDLYMPASSNSVMVHIRHLRSKPAALDSEQVFIETVWGVGYKIAPEFRPRCLGRCLEGNRYEDEDHAGRFVPAPRVRGARSFACRLYPWFHRIDFALPGSFCRLPFRCYRRCHLYVGKRSGFPG